MHAFPNPTRSQPFWRDALGIRHAITGKVLPDVLGFGVYAAVVHQVNVALGIQGLEVSHLRYLGGVLVLLLVLRTNAGHDRWWEARRLWGGIVNQSRNLGLKGLVYGPGDPDWRRRFVRWTAAFAHAVRQSLRDERDAADLARVLAPSEAEAVVRAQHMPSYVALRLAELLAEARRAGVDGWSFQELDRERASLIDHVGGCERILRTPLPRVYSIKLRRLILLYLLGLPFALGPASLPLTVVVTVLVAYPLLAIDQIGAELEDPFSEQRASHLPLDAICDTIQGNLVALLGSDGPAAARSPDGAPR